MGQDSANHYGTRAREGLQHHQSCDPCCRVEPKTATWGRFSLPLTKLILSSINVWLLEQKTLVNGRTRGVLPVVLHRNALVTTLRGLLVDLGLKRRTRLLPALADYLKAAGPAPLEREGAGPEPQGISIPPSSSPSPHDGEP
jgi:hypothetical protein